MPPASSVDAFRRQLEPWVQSFHTENPFVPESMLRAARKPGSRLSVGPLEYQVVELLGNGTEGHVYLAERGGDREVVKVFQDRDRLEENLILTRTYSQKGIPMILPTQVDLNTSTMVFPYYRGVTALNIKKHAREMGLSEMQIQEFEERLDKFKESAAAILLRWRLGKALVDRNILYCLEDGEFRVLDPK